MKKWILKKLLPWAKKNVRIEVRSIQNKHNCIRLTVTVAGFALIENKWCNIL